MAYVGFRIERTKWLSTYRAVRLDVQSAAVIKMKAQVVDLGVMENLAGEFCRFFRRLAVRTNGVLVKTLIRVDLYRYVSEHSLRMPISAAPTV